MGKGKKTRNRSYNKAVDNFKNKHTHQMAEKSKPQKQVVEFPKSLKDMAPGDEFECGSDMIFTRTMLREMRFFCFDCGRHFDTFEYKLEHMRSHHNYPYNTRICRACFSLSENPYNHIHKVPLVENLGSSKGDDESGNDGDMETGYEDDGETSD